MNTGAYYLKDVGSAAEDARAGLLTGRLRRDHDMSLLNSLKLIPDENIREA